ncbi:MAG: TIGR04086 family membrane protein [Alicyclobacillus sp.]|nr:TIGR04086 family membrane protein [Alicyclobacillus sp.]
MEPSIGGTMRTLRRFPILYGVAWGLFVAVVGTLLVSFWVHFGQPGDGHIVVAAYVIHCIAVLCAGVVASRRAGERGWDYGGISGLVYALIMVCIGLAVYNTFSLDAGGLFRVLLMAVIGAFSGIIGVNTVQGD